MIRRRELSAALALMIFAAPASATVFSGEVRMLDAQAIRAALERNGDNRTAAARELGIHKTTLFRRMKKLRLPRPTRDGRSARRPSPSSS